MDSLGEIRHRHPLRNSHEEVRKRLGCGDRFALYISNKVGTTVFGMILCISITSWIVGHLSGFLKLDPPVYFFAWLSLTLNVIQILLLPLLLAGQNAQERQAKARGEYDLDIDKKTEEETDVVVQQLERQNKMLVALLEKHGIAPQEV